MALLDQHADRCVYPRPFPAGFDASPAFQATSFIAADSRNKPLGTWRTCRHLGTGNDLDTRGRFYPRCALGDEQQRLQWLAQVSPAKLDVVRALQDEFDQLSRPHRERLFDARARLHSGPVSAAREPELEQLINGFLSTIDHFLQQNHERFRDVGLPAEPLRQLIKEWVWAWVRTPELARRDSTRSRWKPLTGRPAPSSGPPSSPSSRRRAGSGTGRCIRTPFSRSSPRWTLPVWPWWATSTDRMSRRASQALDAGRRLVLHGIPRQLGRALEIVDWAPLPNLAIAEGVSG